MTEDQFKKLREGDVVQLKNGRDTRVIAEETQHILSISQIRASGIERPEDWYVIRKASATDAASFIPNADPEAYCNEPVRAAGFTNLGIKAGTFVKALKNLCYGHGVQIFSFSPMIIQSLIPGENPIDFPEIQDGT